MEPNLGMPGHPQPNPQLLVPVDQHHHKHHVNGWLIACIITTLLFIAFAGFFGWAYMSRQDYKDNVDQKIATAVEVAKKQTETAKDNEFLEKEKLPLQDYTGPSQYGSLNIKYPKTWSAY